MTKKQLTVGMLAHVDAGKTTLTEALLFESGQLNKLGRVDHQDAFLDTDTQERARGITIFSKQAILPLETTVFTLLDTPGHVDFSGEMERTLQVLDYAILVISGSEGVQSHTRTLWRLLERAAVPTFLFINKMDMADADAALRLAQLNADLHDGMVDFSAPHANDFYEQIAMLDEDVLNAYLDCGSVPQADIVRLIAQRKLFPCFFGSALKLEGIALFLQEFERYTAPPEYPPQFGAKVFKITRDPQGNRLTHMKITGGSIRVKEALSNRSAETCDDTFREEKVNQIRIYSSTRFQTVDEAAAGMVCAVTGLTQTRVGQGLGFEAAALAPMLEPVLNCQLLLPDNANVHTVLQQLKQLEEEDPQLHIVWKESLQEIHVQLMGSVQQEVLKQLIADRFGLSVSFGAGSIIYKETLLAPSIGVGHFEPLRHYAEVHLLMEPTAPGSGLHFAADCPTDMLEGNWQRLVLTHLAEREHPGVLTGSAITDMTLTLIAGRAHTKHTEGGDFRQATYRAVRQGLKHGVSVLLEPWYDLRLEIPHNHVGRAMSDLQRMGGEFNPPVASEHLTVLTGSAPVAAVGNYVTEVTAYTHGEGRLLVSPNGYRPCPEQEKIVAAIGYDSDHDVANPADSVFCSHGTGFIVGWEDVEHYMHVDSGMRLGSSAGQPPPADIQQQRPMSSPSASDAELMSIFERTYGPIKQRDFRPQAKRRTAELPEKREILSPRHTGPEYLLVDGYNIIFAWEDLNRISQDNLDAARQILMDLLCNYQGYKKCEVILVFDAYKVPNGVERIVPYHNIHVVYTKEAETADTYIEKISYELGKTHRVRVATSDAVEQMIIMGHGALRLSARNLYEEIQIVEKQINAELSRHNQRAKGTSIGDRLQSKDK